MKSQQRLTLMILEDNCADIFLLKEALQQAEMNFTTVVFEDGESAFRYIDALGAETKLVPDAAILDLNVPNRDGSEVLIHIRQNLRLRHIPVVFLSSSPTHVMLERAALADCYLTKPDNLDEFLGIGQTIRKCVEGVRATSP